MYDELKTNHAGPTTTTEGTNHVTYEDRKAKADRKRAEVARRSIRVLARAAKAGAR
jgi:hypothetical protein